MNGQIELQSQTRFNYKEKVHNQFHTIYALFGYRQFQYKLIKHIQFNKLLQKLVFPKNCVPPHSRFEFNFLLNLTFDVASGQFFCYV